jgi:glutaredoxin
LLHSAGLEKGKKMKITKFMLGVGLAAFASCAFAAHDITLYYSPTCPHCHNARDFINKTLKTDYQDLNFKEVNVTEQQNRESFVAVLKECGFQSGGVPVMVANGKCFQGYAEFMNTDIMAALGPADAGKADAEQKSADQARGEEAQATQLPEEVMAPEESKAGGNTAMIYIILVLLAAALGVVLFSKKKKK